MEFDRTVPKSIHSPLDELFLTFYDAPSLRRLYTEVYLPAAAQKPSKKVPRKKDLADALIAQTPEQMEHFVARFPPRVREVVSILLWHNEMPLDRVEEQLERRIASEKKQSPYRFIGCPFSLLDDYYLLVIWEHDPYGYGYRGQVDPRSVCYVCLPPALRDWLAPYFPKPPGYDFEGRATLPGHPQRFSCEPHAIQDLVTTADFIRRGGVKRTQNGKIARSSLKNLAAATSGGEPYPGETGIRNLVYFRHRLLIEFVEGLPGPTLRSLADAAIQPKRFLRDCVHELTEDVDWAREHLLPHLRLRLNYGWSSAASADILDDTIRIFGEMPQGQWLTREDLLTYCRYRNIDVVFFELSCFDVQMSVKAENPSYYGIHCYRHNLHFKDLEGVVTWPLLSAIALTLSALGFLEIACGIPKNERYKAKGKDFLSPLEGVQAFRLTDLGAYAFGKTRELDIPALKSNAIELHFHPERLHLRVENIDAITEKTLGSYMDPIGGGIYKISRESFLKGCESTAAVAAHIEQFRRSIPAKLPPNWKQFFDDLKAEPAVLQPERQWKIFRLPENESIRRAFSQDPVLRKHCRKVEGWRVAIDAEQLKIVEKHLRKLGLFPH